eukprot:746772-Hanusia_phi.AAC.4
MAKACLPLPLSHFLLLLLLSMPLVTSALLPAAVSFSSVSSLCFSPGPFSTTLPSAFPASRRTSPRSLPVVALPATQSSFRRSSAQHHTCQPRKHRGLVNFKCSLHTGTTTGQPPSALDSLGSDQDLFAFQKSLWQKMDILPASLALMVEPLSDVMWEVEDIEELQFEPAVEEIKETCLRLGSLSRDSCCAGSETPTSTSVPPGPATFPPSPHHPLSRQGVESRAGGPASVWTRDQHRAALSSWARPTRQRSRVCCPLQGDGAAVRLLHSDQLDWSGSCRAPRGRV